jgi:riboflavin kinase/FMN adenylyltransferase
MVQHLTSLEGVQIDNTWLTVGSFDGVHLGHQQIIHELNQNAHAAGLRSVVLTFHPHPAVVLRGRSDAFYLTTPQEKVDLLDQLGVDIVITHPFTREISQSSARDFVSYLHDHLGFLQLWVGYDFALGRGREGNVTYLRQLGPEIGYTLHLVEPVMYDGVAISSSQIRNLIKEGDIEKANKLLGRSYRMTGEVVHGDGRGKTIGIPTANLETGNEKLIPASGVYACRAIVSGKEWPAAVNVGTRPTFESDDQRPHVEAHILDFSSDLYSQTVTLEFISRLRGEVRYQKVMDLIQQIQLDILQTRQIVNATPQRTD